VDLVQVAQLVRGRRLVNLLQVAHLVQGRVGPGEPISCGTVGAGQMWANVSAGSADNHTLVPVVCVCHAMPVCPPSAPVVWFQLWMRH